jgi:hypothetical protein
MRFGVRQHLPVDMFHHGMPVREPSLTDFPDSFIEYRIVLPALLGRVSS